jgi:YesN/AraC family two-component response regulator
LESFSDNYFDLIFCDLNMPQMDGYDLIKALYQRFPHFESSRIVMVSGEEDASYKKILKEFDVHHFIKKPIQPSTFIHHIRPLVEKIKRKYR